MRDWSEGSVEMNIGAGLEKEGVFNWIMWLRNFKSTQSLLLGNKNQMECEDVLSGSKFFLKP